MVEEEKIGFDPEAVRPENRSFSQGNIDRMHARAEAEDPYETTLARVKGLSEESKAEVKRESDRKGDAAELKYLRKYLKENPPIREGQPTEELPFEGDLGAFFLSLAEAFQETKKLPYQYEKIEDIVISKIKDRIKTLKEKIMQLESINQRKLTPEEIIEQADLGELEEIMVLYSEEDTFVGLQEDGVWSEPKPETLKRKIGGVLENQEVTTALLQKLSILKRDQGMADLTEAGNKHGLGRVQKEEDIDPYNYQVTIASNINGICFDLETVTADAVNGMTKQPFKKIDRKIKLAISPSLLIENAR